MAFVWVLYQAVEKHFSWRPLNNAVHNDIKVLWSTITICYPEAANMRGDDVHVASVFCTTTGRIERGAESN